MTIGIEYIKVFKVYLEGLNPFEPAVSLCKLSDKRASALLKQRLIASQRIEDLLDLLKYTNMSGIPSLSNQLLEM